MGALGGLGLLQGGEEESLGNLALQAEARGSLSRFVQVNQKAGWRTGRLAQRPDRAVPGYTVLGQKAEKLIVDHLIVRQCTIEQRLHPIDGFGKQYVRDWRFPAHVGLANQ